MDNVTRTTVSSVQPGIVMDFLRHRTPNYFSTATRASSATWWDSNGILRDAATDELRYEFNPSSLYWKNSASSNLNRWRTALNNVRNQTGGALVYLIGDSTTRGRVEGNYTDEFIKQLGVPARNDGFSGSGQCPISIIRSVTEFSGGWTNAFNDGTFRAVVGGWMFKHPGNTGGNFTITPTRNASRMRLWFFGNSLGAGTVRVTANNATRATINTSAFPDQYTFVDVQLGATSLAPVTLTWVSGGPLWIGAVEFYNDSLFEVNVINAGWWGATNVEIAFNGGRQHDPAISARLVNADLLIIESGINETLNALTVAEFNTNMQALFNSIALSGSSIICGGQNPTNPDNIAFVRALDVLAETNNFGWCNIYRKWGGLAAANAAGLMNADEIHPSATGFNDKGRTLGQYAVGGLSLPARGLLMEGSRTNLLRNNSAAGLVPGSPGTMPNFTGVFSVPAGLTRTLATGTEQGMPYTEVRYAGTPATTAGFGITFEGNSSIAAAQNDQFTLSTFLKIQSGSLTNISSMQLVLNEFNNVPSFVGGGQTNITPTFDLTRYSFVRTVGNVATASVQPFLQINVTSGLPIDITLRIYGAQLERGAFASSVIRTSTATVTRAADIAAVNNLTNIGFNPAQGTLYSEFETAGNSPSASIYCFGTSGFNGLQLRRGFGDPTQLIAFSTVSGVGQAGLTRTSVASLAVHEHIFAYAQNDFAASFNGLAPDVDTLGDLPSVSILRLGCSNGANEELFGWLRRFYYYPLRISNNRLVELTT